MTRKPKPVHPGLFLRELMTEYELTQYALAKAIGVQPIRIGQIITGKRAITPDTALRLARYFGTDAQSWINWQAQYDLQVAQQALEVKYHRQSRWLDLLAPQRRSHPVSRLKAANISAPSPLMGEGWDGGDTHVGA